MLFSPLLPTLDIHRVYRLVSLFFFLPQNIVIETINKASREDYKIKEIGRASGKHGAMELAHRDGKNRLLQSVETKTP